MRRLLGSLTVLILLASLAGSTHAADVDWRSLKYMEYGSQELFVSTDASWKSATVVAGSRFHRPSPSLVLFGRKVPRNFIWTRACDSDSQTVSFTKTIQAPGVPAEGTITLQLGFGFVGKNLTDGEFLVNGVEINGALSRSLGPRYYSGKLSARARAAFKYGANTLTIRVKKARTKKGEACHHRNRTIGVLADLYLMFKPDMEAVPLEEGREKYVKAAETVGSTYRVRLRNNGPSESAGGRFEFTATFGGSLEGLVIASGPVAGFGPPFKDCQGETNPSFTISKVTCAYADIPAGTTVTTVVSVAAKTKASARPNEINQLNVTWQVTPVGSNASNVSTVERHTTYVCGPTATDPRCPK